jgi:P-type Ca2+ transporter type 2C
MARNILAQSAYQLTVLLLFLLYGPSWLGTNSGDQCVKVADGKCIQVDYTHYTVIFNSFVFCQIFNEFNARSIGDDWKAAFAGLASNPMFLSIIAISILVQIVFVEAFGGFTKTAGLTLFHWFISIAVGAVSVPLGIVMRFIPVEEDENTFRGYTFATTAKDQLSDEGEEER